jgi:hypothetical protein
METEAEAANKTVENLVLQGLDLLKDLDKQVDQRADEYAGVILDSVLDGYTVKNRRDPKPQFYIIMKAQPTKKQGVLASYEFSRFKVGDTVNKTLTSLGDNGDLALLFTKKVAVAFFLLANEKYKLIELSESATIAVTYLNATWITTVSDEAADVEATEKAAATAAETAKKAAAAEAAKKAAAAAAEAATKKAAAAEAAKKATAAETAKKAAAAEAAKKKAAAEAAKKATAAAAGAEAAKKAAADVVVASPVAAFRTPKIKRVGSDAAMSLKIRSADPINDDPKRKRARFAAIATPMPSQPTAIATPKTSQPAAITTPMPFQPAAVVKEEVDNDNILALRARITSLEAEKEKDILALRARITALEAEKEKDILALRARITALEAEKEIHFNGYLRRINLLKVEIARLKNCKTCPQCVSSDDDQDDVEDNLSPEERFSYLLPEKHLEMYWRKKEKLAASVR